jgi:hypothetical protein
LYVRVVEELRDDFHLARRPNDGRNRQQVKRESAQALSKGETLPNAFAHDGLNMNAARSGAH